MPSDPAPLTVSEAVHRAVETCDDGADGDALEELLERFEDDDEPISAVEDIERRLDERVGPREDDTAPAFTLACAVVVYLAHRRDEATADPDELIRLTVRSEWGGEPPPEVATWLERRGLVI